MFNLYEFEKRVRSEEEHLYQGIRDEKINLQLKSMH